MSLQDWLNNGWPKPHKTNRQEIGNLMQIVQRDLQDATLDTLSPDWQFGIAYNAALKLCTILLYINGYRPENALAHYRTIMSLKELSPTDWTEYAIYLNACRMRRNILEYDRADTVSADEACQLVQFTKTLHAEILTYLRQNYPEML